MRACRRVVDENVLQRLFGPLRVFVPDGIRLQALCAHHPPLNKDDCVEAVRGVRDIAALTAETLDEVKGATGRQFRIFADHTKADRAALAACMVSSREPMPASEVKKIAQPTFVAVGETDDMAGDPHALADLLPNGEAFVIPKRNHMLATGDPKFKTAALAWLATHG